MTSRIFLYLPVCITLILAACTSQEKSDSVSADIIFVGDNIITMDDSEVQAVAVIGDEIAATGDADEILKMRNKLTRVVELGGKALLPGFIDAHGHFSGVAQNADLLDLSSPPVGEVNTIDDIVSLLKARIEEQKIKPGEWIFGYGYDDSLLVEGRHPNRDDLDLASTDHPIVLRHVSGHLLSANSAALEAQSINSNTEVPEGGVIRRRPGTREPNGVMEETAMGLLPGRFSGISPGRLKDLLREAVDLYAGFGITTIQDGGVGRRNVDMMRSEAARQPFAIDIVSFRVANGPDEIELASIQHDQNYSGGHRVGGVKFFLDGSPQGRTAWLTQPYIEGPPGAGSDYVAYPTFDPQAYKRRMVGLLERGVPVLAHANGDAAIDLMIDGVAEAVAGKSMPDHRSVTIHAQLMRVDQLDRVKDLGIIPSYYSAHPFFWGDWHRRSFGEERASFISPVRATIDRGIPFTIHNDSPVVPPDMMRLIWITVNRKTRSGYVLGPDQRATVKEALYAVTQGAAYQYFEENEKGSITPGKRADLVILGENPLTVDPMSLKDIPIVETFSRGKSVFLK